VEWRRSGVFALLYAALTTGVAMVAARAASVEAAGGALVRAYPDRLSGVEDAGGQTVLVWKDGTRMPLDDGRGEKTLDAWLAAPDLKDMLRQAYPAGDAGVPPPPGSDPGRARFPAFFNKMYGDCKAQDIGGRLAEVVWLPKKGAQKLKVTSVNGVAARLQAVSLELDALGPSFDVYLRPSAGTYVCRPVAGTTSPSAHGYGIAIDLALGRADYWRWSKGGAEAYRNRFPMEIVRIFEAHGFIWGGKWWHYDTMHFEYRPELLPPTRPVPTP
jgi:hypothetical protein